MRSNHLNIFTAPSQGDPSGRLAEGGADAEIGGIVVASVPEIPMRAAQGGIEAGLVKAISGPLHAVAHDTILFHAGACWRIDREAAVGLHRQLGVLLYPLTVGAR